MSYKLLEIQSTSNNVVNKCFDIVKEVSSNCQVFLNEEGKIYERNYIISFAYQLGKSTQGFEDIVSGELHKFFCVEEDTSLQVSMNKLKRKIGTDGYVAFIPDFVIHSSLNRSDLSADGQKMILEAKTSKDLFESAFCWDLLKLNVAVEQLEFENAVYLIVGHKVDYVETLLDKYNKEGLFFAKEAEKVLFFIQEEPFSFPRLYQLCRDTNL